MNKKNRFIAFVLSAILCLSIIGATPMSAFSIDNSEGHLLGDVNSDGKVNSEDARLALRIAARLEMVESGSIEFFAADADLDGRINAEDARLILRVAAKLEEFQNKYIVTDTLPSAQIEPSETNTNPVSTEPIEEPNESEIGEMYSRDFTDDDIVREEDGVMEYVRNEILLVASESATFDEVKTIVEEAGGEIVGYIEITGDYQVAFENKTESELKYLIESFKDNPFIDDAMLNYVTEVAENALSVDDQWGGDDWSESNPDGNNWGIEAIRAREAWEHSDQMSDIRIGIIDNGFNINHPDFNDIIADWDGNKRNVIETTGTPGHGSHVLGTFAARTNNTEGVSGVFPNMVNGTSPKAEAYCSDNINNTSLVSVLKLKENYTELIVRNVKVINRSEGYSNNNVFAWSIGEDAENLAEIKKYVANPLGEMLHRLIKKGFDFVLVIAAGNSSNNGNIGLVLVDGVFDANLSGHYYYRDSSEACGWKEDEDRTHGMDVFYAKCDAQYSSPEAMIDNYPDVRDRIIVVGAVKNKGTGLFGKHKGYEVCSFSNWGERVDVLAPGYGIYSCSVASEGNYEVMPGTSMAAPHVAGTAAMVWAVNNDLRGDQVKQIVKSTTSVNITDSFTYSGDSTFDVLFHKKTQVNGLIDADAAVEEALRMRDESYSPNFEDKSYGTIATKVVDARTENVVKYSNGETVTGIYVYAYPIVDGVVSDAFTAIAPSDSEGDVYLVVEPGDYELWVYHDGYEPTAIRVHCDEEEVKYADWIKLKRTMQPMFGSVVCMGSDVYYWKYNSKTFSSDEVTFGNYVYNRKAKNELICRNNSGEESVILSANGVAELCVVDGRIYYQEIPASSDSQTFYSGYANCLIKSCKLDGTDIKDHGEGVLRGVIDYGKYIVVEDVPNQTHGILSIDTSTFEKTVLSEDSFLICSDDAVICYRSNRDSVDSLKSVKHTIYSVAGNGRKTTDLHTEKASSLDSIANYEYSGRINGYISVDDPLIVDDVLFYTYEHIAGTAHITQSARITRIDLDTGEAADVTGDIKWGEEGIKTREDGQIDDEATRVYIEYISDPDYTSVLDKEDYSDFSDLEISQYGDESGLLKVEYCEKNNEKFYVLLSYGRFTRYNGWKSLFRFEKCALFEKDTSDNTVAMIYSTNTPVGDKDFLNADDSDFSLLEDTFANALAYHNPNYYDVETTDGTEVFSLLVNDTGGIAGGDFNYENEIIRIEEEADPLNEYTGVWGEGWNKYYGYWILPVAVLEEKADRMLGFDGEFPDEIMWSDELTRAYKYGSDYYVGIPSGIDGVYGTTEASVDEYEQRSDNRYNVVCTFNVLMGEQVEYTATYSLVAGFRQTDGKPFWTIYSFSVVR